jgi:hypothetical protein
MSNTAESGRHQIHHSPDARCISLSLFRHRLSEKRAVGSDADLALLIFLLSVHGSTEDEPIIVTKDHQEGLKKMDKLSEFAPLHVRRLPSDPLPCGL